jgi:hypothetical protein
MHKILLDLSSVYDFTLAIIRLGNRGKLMSSDSISRRELLVKIGYLCAASGGLATWNPALAKLESKDAGNDDKLIEIAGAKGRYVVSGWTGDSFTLGHKLRDRDFPKFPANVSAKVDFVIVGGGIAGLVSAYHLRDHDFLLLEQSSQLGGQARGSYAHGGMCFSYGSTLLSDIKGTTGELLDELDLHPAKLATPSDAWLFEGKWIKGVQGDGANSWYREFARFMTENRAILSKCSSADLVAPLTNPELLVLDEEPLSKHLTSYSELFRQLIDSYLKSYYCAGSATISSLAGMVALKNLIESNYILPGGNSAISITLGRMLFPRGVVANEKRYQNDAFVWSIELADDHSYVTYSTKDGECHKVQCRHVILASPHMVSARLLDNLNSAARVQFYRYRYGSYLVATLILNQKVLDPVYSHYVQPPFSFAKVSAVETPYQLAGAYKKEMGSALTVYQPYEPVSQGRALLLAGDRESFASSIVNQLATLTDGLEENLTQVILTRWGHAMAVPAAGYFANLNKLCKVTSNSYSLAHSSACGLPRIESAITGAKLATRRALAAKQCGGTWYSLPG